MLNRINEQWGMWGSPSLLLLQRLHRPGMVAPDRDPTMGQIALIDRLNYMTDI